MTDTALYYALNTIAPCAAALAALIGFLGMWRLDRLHDEERLAEDEVIAAVLQLFNGSPNEILLRGRAYFLQEARNFVVDPTRAVDELKMQRGDTTIRPRVETYDALRRTQRPLLCVLHVFLVVTLLILGAAVIGFQYIPELTTCAWTTWRLRIAGGWLVVGPSIVLFTAARLPRAIVMLALLFLASPAPNLLLAAEPPPRTLIRSTPGGYKVYSYENAAGETVEETENPLGKLISRRFYRPAPPACAYLKGIALNTDRYWRDDGEQVFHCLSPYKELGTVADPLGLGSKNNLAYYVDGGVERIYQMKLILNVNQRHEAKRAHQELVRAAKVITQQALNTPLPKAAEQAIAAGKLWRGTVKAATLELIRDDWPTGKGYELHFLVRPAGQTP